MTGWLIHLGQSLQRKLGLDDASLDQERERLLREFMDIQQRRSPQLAAAMAAAVAVRPR